MDFKYFNLVSGLENDPPETDLQKSYINPRLIRDQFGQVLNVSQKLFQAEDTDNENLVIDFFDFPLELMLFLLFTAISLVTMILNTQKVSQNNFSKLLEI